MDMLLGAIYEVLNPITISKSRKGISPYKE